MNIEKYISLITDKVGDSFEMVKPINMKNQNTIKCPTCGKQDTWNPNNVTRPFCSERCKMIDLGEWASETRTIPGESIDLNLALQNNDDMY